MALRREPPSDGAPDAARASRDDDLQAKHAAARDGDAQPHKAKERHALPLAPTEILRVPLPLAPEILSISRSMTGRQLLLGLKIFATRETDSRAWRSASGSLEPRAVWRGRRDAHDDAGATVRDDDDDEDEARQVRKGVQDDRSRGGVRGERVGAGPQILTAPKLSGGKDGAAQPWSLSAALIGCETAAAHFVARQLACVDRVDFGVEAVRDVRGAAHVPVDAEAPAPARSSIVGEARVTSADPAVDDAVVARLAAIVPRGAPSRMIAASGCALDVAWRLR